MFFRWTVLAGLLLLAGCQSYAPMPLDEGAHLKSWSERDPGSESVVAYARELAARDAQPRGKYDLSDGISLPEAEVIALFFNPNLRTARLNAGAELAGAKEAGRWEDPELNVDAGWIIQSIAQPWYLTAAISFTIPFSGRPGVERDLAFAGYDVAVRRVVDQEWETLVALHGEWNEAAAVAEHIRLTTEFISQVEAVKNIADRLENSGELTALDARVFALELASRRAELLRLKAEQRGHELKLHELMGLRPDAPLDLKTVINENTALPDDTQKPLRQRNPVLAVKRAEYEVSEQKLRLEIHKQYPDLAIGPGYEVDEGQSRIGIGFGLPIPIINLNREGIAKARAERLAVRSEFEGELETLLQELAQAQNNLAAAREQRAFVLRELAPLADTQVEDARRLADAGEFDALVQLDALTRRHDARMQVLDATLAEARASEQVLALLGPTFKPESKEDKDE